LELTNNISKTQKRGASPPIVNAGNTQQHWKKINARTTLVFWIFVTKVVRCRTIGIASLGHGNHDGLSVQKEGRNKDKENI
jgi:hypothetical protein